MRLRVHHPELDAPPSAPVVRPVVTPAMVKFRNLNRAMRRWKKAGCPLTPGRIRKIRASICAVCPHWSGLGNWGLGECKAPGCGCTRAKVWLATESCPLRKWSAVSVPADQT